MEHLHSENRIGSELLQVSEVSHKSWSLTIRLVIKRLPYGVAGAVQRSGDLSDVVSKALESQDFAIIYHDHRPP